MGWSWSPFIIWPDRRSYPPRKNSISHLFAPRQQQNPEEMEKSDGRFAHLFWDSEK
jgi:hypothetical protein